MNDSSEKSMSKYINKNGEVLNPARDSNKKIINIPRHKKQSKLNSHETTEIKSSTKYQKRIKLYKFRFVIITSNPSNQTQLIKVGRVCKCQH